MNKDLHFKKEILFEALRNILANTSLLLEKGCKDAQRLKEYTIYYTSICMKAYYNFCTLDNEYTKKEMALKKYNLLYGEAFTEAIENADDLKNYLNPSIFENSTEDESFIILAIYNLTKFFTSNNSNRLKHIINTYIPKIRNCLKNADNYIIYFNKQHYSTLSMKSILFKFLVENG